MRRLPLQPLRHRLQHAAVQPREPAVQTFHSREDALPVPLARALALRRVHLAQHAVERAGLVHDFRQKSRALGRRKRDVKAAAAAAARVQLNQAPRAREADRVVPRRHDHHHLAHTADGRDERLLPPLGRLRERRVLAGGEQVQPDDDDAAFVREERFKRLHKVQKLHLPRVAHEPRRGLNARVAFLLHLSAQGQQGGLRFGHHDTALDLACGETFKGRLATVGIDELAKERNGNPSIGKSSAGD